MYADFSSALSTNLLSPPVLFFALGLFAAVLRSDLRLPEPLYVTLTIYLLTALGLKGGVAIREEGLASVAVPGLVAIALGTAIPFWCYAALRRFGGLGGADAASVAAHYGSVSAVTFIAATNYLKSLGVPYESYTTAFLAVMESPAIVVGVLLGRSAIGNKGGEPFSLGPVLREAFLGRSVVLLTGALLVGFLAGPTGMVKIEPFFVTPFQGALALFLLEMGLVTGRRLGDLRQVGPFLALFALLAPVLHACLGVALGLWVGLSPGGATLFGVLAASASYIAAPAAMRLSLPEASPALSLTPALALTFPFNLSFGIPLCHALAGAWSS